MIIGICIVEVFKRCIAIYRFECPRLFCNGCYCPLSWQYNLLRCYRRHQTKDQIQISSSEIADEAKSSSLRMTSKLNYMAMIFQSGVQSVDESYKAKASEGWGSSAYVDCICLFFAIEALETVLERGGTRRSLKMSCPLQCLRITYILTTYKAPTRRISKLETGCICRNC